MKITETSGNSKNGIRGQRISIYVTVDDKMYLIDRFTVTSKYGAIRYCQNHPNGKYGQRYFESIDMAKEIEKTKNVNGLDRVNSKYRII